MQNNLTIRPAASHDVRAILKIYNDTIDKMTASYDLEHQTLDMRLSWFKMHQKEKMPVLVAELDGAVVGWSALSEFRSKAGYRYTVEDSVYIAEGYRGMGIGKALLIPLIEIARTMGMHVIVAAIDSESEASIRLHASLGFEEVGRLKEVGNKFNRWLTVVYMQLIISK